MLQASGLILTCPSCLQEGHAQLDTDNDRDAAEWKIDCHCRERRKRSGTRVSLINNSPDYAVTVVNILVPAVTFLKALTSQL